MSRFTLLYVVVAWITIMSVLIYVRPSKAQDMCYTVTYYLPNGFMRVCFVCNWPTGQTVNCN